MVIARNTRYSEYSEQHPLSKEDLDNFYINIRSLDDPSKLERLAEDYRSYLQNSIESQRGNIKPSIQDLLSALDYPIRLCYSKALQKYKEKKDRSSTTRIKKRIESISWNVY
jgi:hypothetical protein